VLQSENITPVLFWYNPNIHPYTEYKSRKNALIDYAKLKNLEVCLKDEYGLRKFIENIYPEFNSRCEYCYMSRLEETAKYARENGYTAFSTTLLISPYQKHDLICATAQKMAEKYGVDFVYRDFRPYFREGQKAARELGVYMQKYCGCIFSEEERYTKCLANPKSN
jgi:predicted adenine nucleotide alpha hydrolase (AANH) superfamily ATPase